MSTYAVVVMLQFVNMFAAIHAYANSPEVVVEVYVDPRTQMEKDETKYACCYMLFAFYRIDTFNTTSHDVCRCLDKCFSMLRNVKRKLIKL
jgi:hypothetical protein